MKQKKTLRFFAITSVLVLGHGNAEATDLLQAYELARDNDMSYAAALSKRAAVQEKLPQAQALLRPSVEFSANIARNYSDTSYRGTSPFPGGTQQFSSNSYGFNVRQPLYHKQEWMQLDQAHLQLAQADARLLENEQALILRVAQAYFDIQEVQNEISYVQAQKSAITE